MDRRRALTVHHRQQISALESPRINRLDDLAVLCANCHALVHSDPRQAVKVEELATLFKATEEEEALRSA